MIFMAARKPIQRQKAKYSRTSPRRNLGNAHGQKKVFEPLSLAQVPELMEINIFLDSFCRTPEGRRSLAEATKSFGESVPLQGKKEMQSFYQGLLEFAEKNHAPENTIDTIKRIIERQR